MKNPQRSAGGLDGTDLAILGELAADGRLTNSALATRVGIAESTCINRVRALRESGVIEGFRATLNLASLGLPIQAVIKVRLSSHNRDRVLRVHTRFTRIPGVLTVFHVAGEDDYLLHVAVDTPEALRDIVLDHINIHPGVQHTETQLVFEVLPGVGVLPAAQAAQTAPAAQAGRGRRERRERRGR